MKKSFFKVCMFGLFILLVPTVKAQNSNWAVPPNYANVSVNPTTTSILPIPSTTPWGTNDPNDPYDAYDGEPAQFVSNMITKPNGEIDFFIVDGFIYDKNGLFISQMCNYNNGYFPVQGTSEITVVPFPDNCKKYYIFASALRFDITGTKTSPHYFILDMTIPNQKYDAYEPDPQNFGALVDLNGDPYPEIVSPIGDVTGHALYQIIDDANIYEIEHDKGNNCTDFYAATKEKSNGDRLLFYSNSDGIFVFKINQSGVTVLNYHDFPNSQWDPTRLRSELEVAELSNGNYRIAVPYSPINETVGGDTVSHYVFTADYTSAGAIITASIQEIPLYQHTVSGTLYYNQAKGLEFNESGSLLYVTHTTSSLQPNSFEYFDFNNPTTDFVPITLSSPLTQSSFANSLIERRFNNSLVLARQDGLFALADMDVPTSAIANILSFSYYKTNMDLNTTDYNLELFMVPDQIDGMNYTALFEDNIVCCKELTDYNKNTYVATINDTWNSTNPLNNGFLTATIRDELRIPAGKTITIDGMTIKFAPGARLVIENAAASNQQGGKLILKNTTLTVDESCGDDMLWLGVEVWGKQNYAQGTMLSSSQGRLQMVNNSKIEHAQIGVLLSRRTEDGDGGYVFNSYQNQYNGGFVQASNSVFENNHRSMYARPYTNSGNYSQQNTNAFTLCSFEWNDDLKASGTLYHMELDNVQNVFVKGSTFSDSTTTTPYINATAIGIRARNSAFHVDEKCPYAYTYDQSCPEADSTFFNNLNYGVHVQNTNLLTFTVIRSYFKNCSHGIYSTGTQNEVITRNSFYIAEETNQTSGLVLQGSTGYTVEENFFFENIMDLSFYNSYGVVVRNSGIAANQIYNNTFRTVNVSGQSEQVNGTTGNLTTKAKGLQWLCNRFNYSDNYDLTVFGSISPYQGSGAVTGSNVDIVRRRARNTFSFLGESPVLMHDIFVDATTGFPFTYHHLAPSMINQIPDSYTTAFVTNSLTTNLTWDSIHPTTPCPSLVVKGPIIEHHKKSIETFKRWSDSLVDVIDDASSLALLTQISSYPTATSTYDSLMAHSPYLSDDILLDYLNSTASDGYRENVLVANSSLSRDVLTAVSTSNLPTGSKNAITAAQSSSYPREELISEITYLQSEKAYSYNSMMYVALTDTTGSNLMDSVKLALTSIGEQESDIQLLEIAVLEQNSSLYSATRSNLVSDTSLSDYIHFMDLLYDASGYNSVEEAFEADTVLQPSLLEIFNETEDVIVKNRILVMLTSPDSLMEVFQFMTPTKSTMIGQGDENENDNNRNAVNFMLYPNPTNGLVYIDLPDLSEGTMSIQLFDLMGKEVFNAQYVETNAERIDVSHLETGTYIVRVSIDNQQAESKLLQIKH